MNHKRFDKFIVVDENNKPMTFFKNQFCYNETETNRRPFAIDLYSYKEAKQLMQVSKEFRETSGFKETEYFLMPVNKQ